MLKKGEDAEVFMAKYAAAPSGRDGGEGPVRLKLTAAAKTAADINDQRD